MRRRFILTVLMLFGMIAYSQNPGQIPEYDDWTVNPNSYPDNTTITFSGFDANQIGDIMAAFIKDAKGNFVVRGVGEVKAYDYVGNKCYLSVYMSGTEMEESANTNKIPVTIALYDDETKKYNITEVEITAGESIDLSVDELASVASVDDNYIYSSLQDAFDAAQANATVKLLQSVRVKAEIPTMNTSAGQAYTAVVVDNGITFDGDGNTITVTDALCITDDNGAVVSGHTYNSAVYLVNGTVKNLTIDGGNRGILANCPTGNLLVENVSVSNSTYALNTNSAGANGPVELTVKNSTLNGWTSVSNASISAATFENCVFGKSTMDDKENYAYFRPYCEATISGANTAFNDGFKVDASNHDVTLAADVTVTPALENSSIIIANADGSRTITKSVIKNTNRDTYYATLQEAVAVANAGETIQLLADVTGSGVVINKNVTIDLGGKTYTFNKAVGSAGTETLGFQLLKENNITIKNGTLTSTAVVEGKEVKVLIQNYSNLTLDGVTLLDATEHILYALSNNSGANTLNNVTITTDAVAFDVCDYASYTLPTVTVTGNSSFTGKIEAAAKVGNTYYATFDQALAAANAGENKTIDLLAPVTVTANTEYNLEGITVQSAGDAFIVTAGTLTLNGDGTVNAGVGNNDAWCAVWADGGDVIINGGTYSVGNTEGINAVIYTKNGGKAVINGGTFLTGGINWALNENDANRGTITVKGGTFHNWNPANNVSEGPNTNFVADGYIAETTDNGATYTVRAFDPVAKIGDVQYESLADAIADAIADVTADDTIEFLADINENVTIGKDITIDGADFNYTGTMTISKSITLTVENVNFVEGNVVKGKSTGTSGTYTFKNCSFTSEDDAVYAVELRGTGAIVIENCTSKGYMGMLQVPSSNNSVSIKDVTIANTGYAVKVDYSNGVTLENVTITGSTYGFVNSNYGEKTITVKNCENKAEYPIVVWDRNTGKVNTFKFEGTNDFGSNAFFWNAVTEEEKALTKFVLADANATWTAVEGLNVTTDVEGFVVKYENDTYKVSEAVAKIVRVDENGDKYEEIYPSLQAAIKASVKSETVYLLKNLSNERFTIGYEAADAREITIDLGGFTLSSNDLTMTLSRAGTKVTLQNGTLGGNSTGGSVRATWDATLILGSNLTVKSGGQADAIELVNGKLIVNENVENLLVKGGIGCVDADTDNQNQSPTVNHIEIAAGSYKGVFTVNEASTCVLTGGTFTQDVSEWCAENYIARNNGDGTWTVVLEEVAAIGETTYPTIQAAIDAAEDGETIILLKDITVTDDDMVQVEGGYNVMYSVDKDITIDFAGYTVNVDYNGGNYLYAVIYVADGANLVVTDSSENAAGGIDIAENGIHVAYMFWKRGTTGSLTINNGTFHMDDAADSMVYTNGDEIVTVNGGKFTLDAVGTRANGFPCIFNAQLNNEKNVVVKGGTYNFDVQNQHWRFESLVPKEYASHNNGDGTWTIKNDAVAYVGEVYKNTEYKYNAGYATFAEAYAAADEGETITLLETILLNEDETLDKEVTVKVDEDVDINPAFRIMNGATVTVGNADINTEADGYNFILGASDGSSAGNLIVKSGKYHGSTSAISVTKGNLTIEGGEFSATPWENEYTFLINCIDANYNDKTATVAISGGKFHNWNPQDNAAEGANTNFCAEGFGAIQTAESIWEVRPAQTISLHEGWDWFSSYVDLSGEDGLAKLQTALTKNATQIKSHHDGFTNYIAGNDMWFNEASDITPGMGILTSLSSDKMYMINMNVADDIELVGDILDPSKIVITLDGKEDQNILSWISYPVTVSMSVNETLSNLEATPGDIIKSHCSGYAQYLKVTNPELGITGVWAGTLETLEPGKGYKYTNTSGEEKDFSYTKPASTRGELKANVTAENNHFRVNARQYPNNMTVTAVLNVNGEMMAEDCEIAAFVNGECRGSARPIYIEPLDAYMFFLTIHGDDVEEVTFRYIDLATYEEYALNERINYSNDAALGTIAEPFVLSCGTMGIDDMSANTVSIYPNPTTTGNEINLESTCDVVEIFNALGVKIAEYQNVDTIDAFETAGIYVIRITNNNSVQHCRLIVK